MYSQSSVPLPAVYSSEADNKDDAEEEEDDDDEDDTDEAELPDSEDEEELAAELEPEAVLPPDDDEELPHPASAMQSAAATAMMRSELSAISLFRLSSAPLPERFVVDHGTSKPSHAGWFVRRLITQA